jgi:hypothetical protein
MIRARLTLSVAIAISLAAIAPGLAQQTAPAQKPAASVTSHPNMSGRVITRQKLADCRRQAREAKLTYLKRRQFIRDCVNVAAR